jgi:ferric-dicitrate binding protein FerR (iron transport regulator)
MLNEATADEQEQVRLWLEADQTNRSYFNQLQQIWEEGRHLAKTTTVDENEAWLRFRQRISPTPIRKNNFAWIRIAAAIVIIAGIGLIGYLTLVKAPETLIVSAVQGTLTDTLPDGSVVSLNKGSSISYPEKFNDNTRKVILNGEAFFQVSANRERPFIIAVNNVQVIVTGTSFNIKTIDNNTEVVVESGIVEVISEGKSLELRANEKTLVTTKNVVLVKEKVSDRLYQFYRTKQFVCDDTPLWKLVKVINEAYDAKIVIDDPALRNLSLTTTFNNESLDQVLNIISITFDIDVTKSGDSIILKK